MKFVATFATLAGFMSTYKIVQRFVDGLLFSTISVYFTEIVTVYFYSHRLVKLNGFHILFLVRRIY